MLATLITRTRRSPRLSVGPFHIFLVLVIVITGALEPRPAVAAEPLVHQVGPGETIRQIAAQYGVSAEAIVAANGISNPDNIMVGQRLVIPGVTASTIHTVAAGENLLGIANRYGVTVAAILEVNDLANPDLLVIGQEIIIPGTGGTASAPAAAVATPTSAPTRQHTVVAGETLIQIARAYGVPVSALIELNGLVNPDLLHLGQVLNVPAASGGQQPSSRGDRPVVTATPAPQPVTPRPAVAATPTPAPAPTAEGNPRSVGVWQITYYCLTGMMANGQQVYVGAAAADASILKFGTKVRVAGRGDFTITDRFARDLRQNRLDLWMADCREALRRGVEQREVWIIE